MTQKQTTSNKKIARKVHQQFSRAVRREVKEQVTVLKDAIKPRPKYVPLWLWQWLVGLVFAEDAIKKWVK